MVSSYERGRQTESWITSLAAAHCLSDPEPCSLVPGQALPEMEYQQLDNVTWGFPKLQMKPLYKNDPKTYKYTGFLL